MSIATLPKVELHLYLDCSLRIKVNMSHPEFWPKPKFMMAITR